MQGLRAGAGYRLELDARTAYDFAISLAIGRGESDELLPEDARWLSESRAALGATTADPVLFGGDGKHGLSAELASLVASRPEVHTAADLVAALDGLADEAVIEYLLLDLFADETLGPLARRALAGEPGTIDAFEAAWAECKPELDLGGMIRDPVGAVGRLRAGLRAWLEPFQTIEARIAAMQARDLADRRSELQRLTPEDFVEQATGGLRWLPEPEVRRLILAPSYFSRPYNRLFQGADWRLICYPVADTSLDGIDRFAPPLSAVRLYRALGDETRLRLLRHLAERDWYLTELAGLLELSKPTVKHHLTQLRTAGLVTITEEGGLTYYSLRRNRVEEAGPELARYLGR